MSTMTKARPIIMSAHSVRAILAGRKTQTRRIIEPQPYVAQGVGDDVLWGHEKLGGYFAEHVFGDCFSKLVACPYGQAGDILCAKESWRIAAIDPDFHCIEVEYLADGTVSDWLEVPDETMFDRWMEQSGHDLAKVGIECDSEGACNWEPSKSPLRKRHAWFLPLWASRLRLRNAGVRVEKVQEINHEDALAEGAEGFNWVSSSPYIIGPHTDDGELPVEEFARTWDELHGKGAWDRNDWVRVITFERTEAPQ